MTIQVHAAKDQPRIIPVGRILYLQRVCESTVEGQTVIVLDTQTSDGWLVRVVCLEDMDTVRGMIDAALKKGRE